MVQNSIILHDNARIHTTAVMDLLHRWQWEILENPPYSRDISPCDCNLFAKVKQPLWGTLYNTGYEFIPAIGQSVWNINKDGHFSIKIHYYISRIVHVYTYIYFLLNHNLCSTLCIIRKTLKSRKQTNMEGGQNGTYLRLTRVSSGPWVSVSKTYRDETKQKN